MVHKKGVKCITVPKFIIHKFDLTEYPMLDIPDYVKKSGICLKNAQGATLNVDNLTQLRDILAYFRAAAQVCLQLIYKHMVIEQKNTADDKKDDGGYTPQKKLRHRRKEGQNRASSSSVTSEPNEDIQLNFGLSKTLIFWWNKEKEAKLKQDGDGFNNEFYRHLIMQTRRKKVSFGPKYLKSCFKA